MRRNPHGAGLNGTMLKEIQLKTMNLFKNHRKPLISKKNAKICQFVNCLQHLELHFFIPVLRIVPRLLTLLALVSDLSSALRLELTWLGKNHFWLQ